MSTEGEIPGRGFTMVDSDDEANPASDPAREGGREAIPAIDFSTFVLSLGTSALYQIDQLEDPESDKKPAEPDLVIARQTINTLEMLSKKTQGNLEPEEAKLLESVLYELRMRFVEACKREGSGAG